MFWPQIEQRERHRGCNWISLVFVLSRVPKSKIKLWALWVLISRRTKHGPHYRWRLRVMVRFPCLALPWKIRSNNSQKVRNFFILRAAHLHNSFFLIVCKFHSFQKHYWSARYWRVDVWWQSNWWLPKMCQPLQMQIVAFIHFPKLRLKT